MDAHSRSGHADIAAPAGDTTARNLYLAGLIVAFGLFLALRGPGNGIAFWALSLAAGGGLASGFGGTSRFPFDRILPAAVALAFTLAAGDVLTAGPASLPIADRVADLMIWPHVLVGLFGSRVMAEENELRAARYWAAPGAGWAPHAQSTLSAVGLALALALAFWWLLPRVAGDDAGPAAAVFLRALHGETFLHHAIIVLFLVLVGFVIDGFWLVWRDRAAVDRLAEDGDVAAMEPGARGRLLPQVEAMAGRTGLVAASTLRHMQASRRFVRSLVPVLPMLGFLGTVIGLSLAIGDLPKGLGQQPGQPVDIAGSLGGLALKFETTLLGLAASMVASVALSALDRAENELVARCSLVMAALPPVRRGE